MFYQFKLFTSFPFLLKRNNYKIKIIIYKKKHIIINRCLKSIIYDTMQTQFFVHREKSKSIKLYSTNFVSNFYRICWKTVKISTRKALKISRTTQNITFCYGCNLYAEKCLKPKGHIRHRYLHFLSIKLGKVRLGLVKYTPNGYIELRHSLEITR